MKQFFTESCKHCTRVWVEDRVVLDSAVAAYHVRKSLLIDYVDIVQAEIKVLIN